MKELNIRIKQKRQECGLTLLEVADLLGVKEATVQRYESGSIKNIKHETICKLAEIFHCSPSWLMGFDIHDEGDLRNVGAAISPGMFREPPIERDAAPAAAPLTEQEAELIRVFQSLSVKGQTRLLSYAFELEKEEG